MVVVVVVVERLPWPWSMGMRFPEEELGRGVEVGVCVERGLGRGVVVESGSVVGRAVVVEIREVERWKVGGGTAISGSNICGRLVGVIRRVCVWIWVLTIGDREERFGLKKFRYSDVLRLRLCAAMSKYYANIF